MIATARFCSRCGLALPSQNRAPRPSDKTEAKSVRLRWYQIGRLNRSPSALACFLSMNLGLIWWFISPGRRPANTPEGIGALVGSVVGMFGLTAAFGWIASSLAWRVGKKLQSPTVIAFVLGAAGIFSLVALSNAQSEQARVTAGLPSAAQNGIPSRVSSVELDDIFDQTVLEEALLGRGKLPTKDERMKLAQAYLSGSMRPDTVPVYERAIRRAVVPDPRDDWKGPLSLRLLQRLAELVPTNPPLPPGFVLDPAPHTAKEQPMSRDPFAHSPGTKTVPAPTPPADVDLPAGEVRNLNVAARKDDADVVIEATEPDGWVLSALMVRFMPVGNPADVGLPKTFVAPRYIPLAGEHGKAHFFIKDALAVGPGEKEAWLNWSVVGARGRRIDNQLPDPEKEAHTQVVDAVSNLRLQAIITSRPMSCKINGSVYRVGQQIGGLTVEEITPKAVIVRGGKYRFELRIAR